MKILTHKFSNVLLTLLISTVLTAPVSAAIPALTKQGGVVPTLAPMLDAVTPAVVNIATEGKRAVESSPFMNDPLFERFFGVPRQQRERRTQGLGSGVVFDAKRGYIVTNSHVIENADDIRVTLKDGRSFKASLIGADPDADIAVIKIDADNLKSIPLSSTDEVRVGDFVVAIGNPFGLQQTVTSGIVSALGRSGLGIESYEDFIQTDASINPGNSGGALVNLKGELVGINTAILGPNGGNIGIGFAIPINMVQSITAQLIEHGEVRRGRLGIGIQDLTPELAKAFNSNARQGAVVSQVEEQSPAEAAGIQVGDVIVAVNGKEVDGASELRNAIGLLRAGTKVKLSLLRDGRRKDFTVRIEEPKKKKFKGNLLSNKLGGATFSNTPDGQGVLITEIEPGSPASRAGLMEGDIILSVNRQAVRSVEEMQAAVSGDPQAIILNILRNGRGLFLLIQ